LQRENLNATLLVFGVYQTRLSALPALTSSNGIGSLCALSIFGLAYLAHTSKQKWWLYAALMLPCFVGLIRADTRSAMIILALAVLIYLFVNPFTTSRGVRAMTIFAALSAFILTAIFTLLADSEIGQLMMRQGERAARLGAG